MTREIEYEQFDEQQPQPGGARRGEVDLRRISEVPMELSVEIGRTQMTVGETLELRAGTVVSLDRLAGDPVDLLVNGTPIARGEVVVVDEKFALRVQEIVEAPEGADDATALAAGGAAPSRLAGTGDADAGSAAPLAATGPHADRELASTDG